jgi:23S rRNA (cytidine1920-2'-O)/16S rRNA (cytidine1409-2'-O)-methyltransferase
VTRRRLDQELVRRGLAASRTRAAEVIASGRVRVGGAPADKPARLVAPDEPIAVEGEAPPFVSRGGEKLAAALDRFAVTVAGLRCLDAGASTGGFTDCLLQHGAQHVVAVDVGHGQLAWSLRADSRVTVLERTNIRELTPDRVGGMVDLIVADLSFISLRTVAPALTTLAPPGGDALVLVKPQFEAGRDEVGKGGIVRDPDVHRAVLERLAGGLAAAGLAMHDLMVSPLRGADGNTEFFARCQVGSLISGVSPAKMDAVVIEAHQ